MYLNGNWAVRHFFWMRPRLITSMIERLLPERSDCLDFGGGSGVFHPTLSRLFRTVTCVDLDQTEATEIGKRYGSDVFVFDRIRNAAASGFYS